MANLSKSTRRSESLRDPNWETRTSANCTRWLFWGHDKLMLVPGVTGGFENQYCKIGYVEMPKLLASATDTPDARIPIKDQEFLKYAAAYYLLNMRTDKQFTDMAEYFMQTFHKLIGA